VCGYSLFHADFLFRPFIYPEDGGDIFLQNIDWLSTEYMVLYPRRQKHEICLKFSFYCSLTSPNRFFPEILASRSRQQRCVPIRSRREKLCVGSFVYICALHTQSSCMRICITHIINKIQFISGDIYHLKNSIRIYLLESV
jgi:hypothetical protein